MREDYSTGVHSNGNGYVEGELSWGTSALLGDTDDDGVIDGEEVAGGTDPLTSATRAQDRLSLRSPPEVRMEFRLRNNLTLDRAETRVRPANGGTGMGREYMSLDPVEVEVINVQPFTH